MRGSTSKVYTVPFSRLQEVGIGASGSKAANLGQLLSLRLPVPNGFVISSNVFDDHFGRNKLYDLIQKELQNLDPYDSVRLENASKKIRNAILRSKLDKDTVGIITKAYSALSGFSDAYVAVRSSSLLDDLRKDSFAGQYSSFLNIKGKNDLLEKVKHTWSSIFTPHNLFYALASGVNVTSLKMALIVQKMIQSEASGIMFTLNPVDNDESKISIECVLGLGEALADGDLTPDTYLVDKEKGEILEKKVIPQEWMLVRKGRAKKGEDPNVKVKVGNIWKVKQKLENKYIKDLVKIGKTIEKHFGSPQHIEWAYEGGRVWVIQTRTVSTLKIEEDSWKKTPTFSALKAKVEASQKEKLPEKKKKVHPEVKKEAPAVLLSGRATSGGYVSGVIKVAKASKDLRKIKSGTVLVVPNVTPDFEEKLEGVVAILTDNPSSDSYETIISRSLGVPCLVETNIGTQILKDGEYVTVNGNSGDVFAGSTDQGLLQAEKILQQIKLKERQDNSQKAHEKLVQEKVKKEESKLKTATKLYVSIENPNEAPGIAAQDADGVGVIDLSCFLESDNLHPSLSAKRKRDKKQFINNLTLGLFRTARSFEPRPVIYELSDMTTLDYANLKGGREIESVGQNPKLGLKGASRYISNPQELELELDAIRIIRNKEGIKNIWVSIPYARSYEELREMKNSISAFGFRRSSTFKLFFVVSTPSCVVDIDKLLDLGVDGVILDIDDLTQLFLGIDLEDQKVSQNFTRETDAILWAAERVIKACNKNKVHVQVRGQLIQSDPKFVTQLIKWGITSVSTSADMLTTMREYIYEAEKSLIMKKR